MSTTLQKDSIITNGRNETTHKEKLTLLRFRKPWKAITLEMQHQNELKIKVIICSAEMHAVLARISQPAITVSRTESPILTCDPSN